MRCGACSTGSRPSSIPFCASLGAGERRRAAEYLTGLLSHLEHKTAEGIAYLLDQDRQPMQRFIGQADWDHRPLLAILAAQVGERLGEPDGVIVFDPSAFAKKGDKSVGVARQWCGRLGKVENCQVGVYMGYVSRIEHALVNFRLFLPEEWTKDRARCRAAGIPREVRVQTRHELALEMLAESGPVLPHAWVAGDDEMGRPEWFRRALRDRGERYLLAVPSNTLIRDQEVAPPEYSGRGRHPKNPFTRVDVWAERLAGGGLDADRGPRRREGAAGGRGGEAAGAGAGRDGRGGAGRIAVHHAGASSGPYVQVGLLPVVRGGGDAAGRAGPGGEGGASDRGMPGAGQGGGGVGRLPGEELAGVASASDPGAAGRVVPHRGDAAGEKSGPRL